MPKRNLAFFDPKHNQWLFDVLVNLTMEQKSKLNTRELRELRSKSTIKKFVATGNLEKKLILLTKLGVEWNILFYVPNKFSTDIIKQAYRQYAIKASADTVEKMVKSKTFVLSSRDVAISLAMMNMNCHSDIWLPNIEFLKVRQTTNEIAANISRSMSDRNLVKAFNQGYNGLRIVTNIVNEAMLLDSYLMSVYSLQQLDMVILNLLFKTPNNYVAVSYIKTELKHTYKPIVIGLRCSYLWKQKKMIDKMPAAENVSSYRITQEGILTVGAIANFIVNRAAGLT
jgi:hypothetical protein